MDSTIELNIPNIEKELARLWKQAEEKRINKACLFSLVIFAHEPARIKDVQDLIDNILAKFPCRLIFIKADLTTEKRYFNVEVSTVFSGSIESKSTIACDQIVIKASKDQLFRVPYLVIPHLEADLPVFLLWGQNPYEDTSIFPALQPYASRVIFDSECSSNLNLFCQEMLGGLSTLGIDIMDINWALLSNWRDLLQQLFSSPEMNAELLKCKSLVITYNEGTNNDKESDKIQYPEIRAIYLQGWLAACLKWRFRRLDIFNSNTLIQYFSKENPLVVEITPTRGSKHPIGAITSLQFITTDNTSIDIQRNETLSQVIVHTSNTSECQLPYTMPLPSAHRGLNFIKEIFYNEAGEHYTKMLKMIANLDFDIIKNRTL